MREDVTKILEVVAGHENLSYSQWVEKAIIEKLQRDYGLTIEAFLRNYGADKPLLEVAHILISSPILLEKRGEERS
jgi:translation initiation factor 2 alpha subunit (eIF-2alpha)